MPSPDNAGNGSDPAADIGAQRSAISSAGLDSDNQESFPSDTASSETERLLDINGLLDMVKLISVARREGRLGGVGRRSSDHVDE
jgi:hypothetical protein